MKDSMRFATVLGVTLMAGCATTPPSYLQETEHAWTDSHGVQRADVVAGNFWFRPDHIIVKANEPVMLIVKKRSTVIPHSFVIHAPEAGINVDVPLSPEPTNIEFTPTRPGRYTFYCDEQGLFESHRAKGMEGVLEVVP